MDDSLVYKVDFASIKQSKRRKLMKNGGRPMKHGCAKWVTNCKRMRLGVQVRVGWVRDGCGLGVHPDQVQMLTSSIGMGAGILQIRCGVEFFWVQPGLVLGKNPVKKKSRV